MASPEMEDPMDAVPESEVGGDDEREGFEDTPQQSMSSVAMGGILDPSISLQMPAEGMRTLLGRKARNKPLLKLVCKGCLKSSQDADDFIQSDFLEWPGSIEFHIDSESSKAFHCWLADFDIALWFV